MTSTETLEAPAKAKTAKDKDVPAGYRRTDKHRCGFCLDGKCAESKCVSAVWWDVSKQLYICPCPCNAGHTRCTRCGSRDVEVTTHTSQCTDMEACDGQLAKKRANNPNYQALMRAREGLTSRATAANRPAAMPKAPKGEGGKCLCCGEATRGGLFLPGHDARYVSREADTFLAADPEEKAAILDRLESQLSPKLMHKWVSRVERQSIKNEKNQKVDTK